jgi:hypothetical protein
MKRTPDGGLTGLEVRRDPSLSKTTKQQDTLMNAKEMTVGECELLVECLDHYDESKTIQASGGGHPIPA